MSFRASLSIPLLPLVRVPAEAFAVDHRRPLTVPSDTPVIGRRLVRTLHHRRSLVVPGGGRCNQILRQTRGAAQFRAAIAVARRQLGV